MSDAITNLGITDEEFREENEVLPLGAINDDVRERNKTLKIINCSIGDVRLEDNAIYIDNEDYFYTDALADYMGLPAHYLSSCSQELRNMNLNWWIEKMKDKDVRFAIDNGMIITVTDPNATNLELEEVLLKIEPKMMDIASVYCVESLRTKMMVDICNRDLVEFDFGGGWQGGIRIIQPLAIGGKYAPKIMPYLRSYESSAPLAFPQTVKIETRSMSKQEVVNQLKKSVDETIALLAEGAKTFREIWDKKANLPSRITKQVMKENKVHYRIINSIQEFIINKTDNGEELTVGDIVRILSSFQMQDGLSMKSREGLSSAAGLYFLGEAEKNRCPTCFQRVED